MKNKLCKLKGGIKFLAILLFSCSFISASLAAGTLYVSRTNDNYRLRNFSGGIIDPTSANIQYYLNSAPASPLDNGIQTSYSGPELDGDDYKWTFLAETGTVVARLWAGAIGSSDYVVFSTGYKFDNGASSPLTLTHPIPSKYFINAQATWHASAPGAPTIGPRTESLVVPANPDDPLNDTVSFTVSYDQNANHIQLSANSAGNTNYEVQMRRQGDAWPPEGALGNANVVYSNGSVSFNSQTNGFVAGDTLEFRARASNWFGTGPWSATVVHSTYAGGVGAETPLVYNLDISYDSEVENGYLTWQSTIPNINFDIYGSTDKVTWKSMARDRSSQSYDFNFVTALGKYSIIYITVVPAGQDVNAYPLEVVGIARTVLAHSVVDPANPANNRTGITSLSLPFSETKGFANTGPGEGTIIQNATQLRDTVNTLIANSFEFVGGWNAATQSETFFAIDAGGNPQGDPNMPLAPGVGYQLSVGGNSDLNLILIGK